MQVQSLILATLVDDARKVKHGCRGGYMEITDVRIFPVSEEKLKAYVAITLDGCFVVRDLKIIQGVSGLFVAMPSKKQKDGTYKDIAHPLNPETRQWMERAIITRYEIYANGDGELPLLEDD